MTRDPLAPERLASMRREYERDGIDVGDLKETWIEQLRCWLADAEHGGVPEPNAIVLATADGRGHVSARTVLLKGLEGEGLVFYTNAESRKGRALAENPRASLLLPWYDLRRQVEAQGVVERVPEADSDAYWATRPYGSQVGSAASRQSEVLPDRAALDAAYARVAAEHPDRVPRPAHWGGFRLVPESVEFWQGRLDRLHDRLRYRREGAAWVIERLAP